VFEFDLVRPVGVSNLRCGLTGRSRVVKRVHARHGVDHGFAARPDTAVLPMCSIGPTIHARKVRRRTIASVGKSIGQEGSYGTISIGASSDVMVVDRS
jgi:hypothetical protein